MSYTNSFFKNSIFLISFLLLSFTKNNTDNNWWICINCCKTEKAINSPWHSGCKMTSSNYHNFQFMIKAGETKITCASCGAEVYGVQGQTPAASTCCETGGTHNWRY